MANNRKIERDVWSLATVNQAETLPTGWRWSDTEDGTGCLMNPNDDEFFIYDSKPYGESGGILYQVRAEDETKIHWGGISGYKDFVEKTVNDILTIAGVNPQQNDQSFDMQL